MIRKLLLRAINWRWNRAIAACARWEATDHFVRSIRFPTKSVFDTEE